MATPAKPDFALRYEVVYTVRGKCGTLSQASQQAVTSVVPDRAHKISHALLDTKNRCATFLHNAHRESMRSLTSRCRAQNHWSSLRK
jgi:hypothetical protein